MPENWLKKYGQPLVYKIINPLVLLLIKWRVKPNTITTIGLFINAVAACILIAGGRFGERSDHSYLGWAGIVILSGGLFDMIDGRLARLSNTASRFGALYDSVLDRYSELIMFLGICWYLVSHGYLLGSLFAFIGMIGSVMVSYIRARAESLGAKASDGLMQRPERILLIGLSAIGCWAFSEWVGNEIRIVRPWCPLPLFETITVFTFPLMILAILTNVTAIGRLRQSQKQLEQKNK